MKMLNKIIGGSIAIAAVLAFSASTTQAQNLLVDPNFGGPFIANPIAITGINGGWAVYGNSTSTSMVASPVDRPYNGAATALLEVNAPGNAWNPAGAYQIVGGGGIYPTITPGATYTYSIWAITDTGTAYAPTPVDLQLSFNDSTD